MLDTAVLITLALVAFLVGYTVATNRQPAVNHWHELPDDDDDDDDDEPDAPVDGPDPSDLDEELDEPRDVSKPRSILPFTVPSAN